MTGSLCVRFPSVQVDTALFRTNKFLEVQVREPPQTLTLPNPYSLNPNPNLYTLNANLNP